MADMTRQNPAGSRTPCTGSRPEPGYSLLAPRLAKRAVPSDLVIEDGFSRRPSKAPSVWRAHPCEPGGCIQLGTMRLRTAPSSAAAAAAGEITSSLRSSSRTDAPFGMRPLMHLPRFPARLLHPFEWTCAHVGQYRAIRPSGSVDPRFHGADGHALGMERNAIGAAPVDRDELRSVQGPLKDQYSAEPAAALVTLHAEGSLGEGISCSVATGRAIAQAGLHPATGGDGSLLCSGDMLLEALAACAGVTLRSVAASLEIPIRGGRVIVEGDLDFRGTLAVTKDAPVGFTDIRLRFDLDADATDDQLDTLVRLTERYCVVLQTLTASPTLSVTRNGP